MLSFLTASVLRDLSFKTRLGRRPHTINTDSLASLHSTQLTRLTLTFFFPRSTNCNRDAASSLIVGGARIQADKWLRTTRRSNHGAKGIAPTKKQLPEIIGLPWRAFAQAVGEQRCANTCYPTHVCSRQTTGARTTQKAQVPTQKAQRVMAPLVSPPLGPSGARTHKTNAVATTSISSKGRSRCIKSSGYIRVNGETHCIRRLTQAELRANMAGGSSSSGSRGSSSGSYTRGPRGGCYTMTSGGKKRYVDRSRC